MTGPLWWENDEARSPHQEARNRAETGGQWPADSGPYHRHFADPRIHLDSACDRDLPPSTHRRVYVFDPDYLDQHERAVARLAVEAYKASRHPEDLHEAHVLVCQALAAGGDPDDYHDQATAALARLTEAGWRLEAP